MQSLVQKDDLEQRFDHRLDCELQTFISMFPDTFSQLDCPLQFRRHNVAVMFLSSSIRT